MNAQTLGIGKIARANVGRCPAGCDFVSMGPFEDASGKVGNVEVLRCSTCGLGVTMPPLPNVAFLYEGRESQDFQQGENLIARWIKQVAFKIQARRLLKNVPGRLENVLDFGCGSGLFTRCLSEMLPHAKVTGSDFHGEAPPDLSQHTYVSMDALHARKGSFDLVLAMHVLEHDDDALGLLDRMVGMAKPGGIVVVEVPNIDCVWTPVFGRAWDAWYVPFHRSHFSRRALSSLVTASGLEIIAEVPVCVPTFGRSFANVMKAPKGFGFLLLGVALHPIQMLGEKIFGRPSAWRIVARKI